MMPIDITMNWRCQMTPETTRKMLAVIRRAIITSIEKGNTDLLCQQGNALIIAMKDHIDALEKRMAVENLKRRYGR
jgi:hypothetical protein